MKKDLLFFETPETFREWLAQNHNQKAVQWGGYYKVDSGNNDFFNRHN